MTTLQIPVSLGELIDKITILAIKAEHVSGQALDNVQLERRLLEAVLGETGLSPDGELVAQLEAINRTLWQIEDDIRDHERRGDFGAGFIALARSVYRSNDRRAAIKRAINEQYGSELIEEKAYRPY